MEQGLAQLRAATPQWGSGAQRERAKEKVRLGAVLCLLVQKSLVSQPGSLILGFTIHYILIDWNFQPNK